MRWRARLLLLGAAVLEAAILRTAPANAELPNAASGRFRFITYNVAGLPEGISSSHPATNLPQIGKLLSDYDIAVVQEDFAYPAELRRSLHLAYASVGFAPGQARGLGDGLSQFARWPFTALRREAWSSCHGIIDSFFDCLTPKGFSVSQQSLAPGAPTTLAGGAGSVPPQPVLRLYNLHMDAGWSPEDHEARVAQVEQLLTALRSAPADQAIVIGGDTNMHGRERALLEHLMTAGKLEDACAAVACPDPRRIDRVLYRSSPALELHVRRWAVARQFVDASGAQLSDHLPVEVEFEWRVAAGGVGLPVGGAGLRGRPGL
jgi:hypothetical protein